MVVNLQTIPSDAKCITCRWWSDGDGGHIKSQFKGDMQALIADANEHAFSDWDSGFCERYPKVPVFDGEGVQHRHPQMLSWELCGEWTPIPPPTVPQNTIRI